MKGLRLQVTLTAILTVGLLPVAARASCSPSMMTTSADIATATATTNENVGLYEWDAAQEVWVLLGASYHASYESEAKQSFDIFVPDSTLWADPYDRGFDSTKPQRQPGKGKGHDNVEVMCETATTLPRVTATGNRPINFGGSLLSVIWRGQLLNGSYGGGGAQRSSVAPLPAPSTAEPVTCDSEMEVKSANAQHTAGHYGLKPGPRNRNQRITIRWSTGTVETYYSTGNISNLWMLPVPDTCKPAPSQ